MAGIATRKVKWDRRYQKKHGITHRRRAGAADGAAAYLDKMSKRIYRALYMTGYARMDFRMRPDGSVYVLEANANPNISREEDYADPREGGGGGLPDVAGADHRMGTNYQAAWRVDET